MFDNRFVTQRLVDMPRQGNLFSLVVANVQVNVHPTLKWYRGVITPNQWFQSQFTALGGFTSHGDNLADRTMNLDIPRRVPFGADVGEGDVIIDKQEILASISLSICLSLRFSIS